MHQYSQECSLRELVLNKEHENKEKAEMGQTGADLDCCLKN